MAACGADPPTVTPEPALAHFDAPGIAFDYPATWNVASFDMVSSFSALVAYLSTEPLFDPCVRTPNSIACEGLPVRQQLGPNGVLVDWTHRGWPGWEFDPTAGPGAFIGGRRATVQHPPVSGRCASIGGNTELLVVIDSGVQSNWDEVWTCSRQGLDDLTASQIDAMLASVRWKN